MDKKPEAPKFYLILRIVALLLILVGITLVILACTVLSTEEWYGTEPSFGCLIPGVIMVFFSIPTFMFSMGPVFHKLQVKTEKYVQEVSKEDLQDIATTRAEIGAEATEITAKAMATGVKDGFRDTKFCKHCGAEIDRDSKFCTECGGAQ